MIPRLILLLCILGWPFTKWTDGESAPLKQSAVPDPAFRTRVDEVQVTFSAEDAQSRSLSNVFREDIAVLEDGKSVSEITSFRPSFALPVRLAILLDRSASMQKGFPAAQRAAQQFVSRVIRLGDDSVFLVEFSNRTDFSEPPPGRPDLIFAAHHSHDAGSLTALYDALYETSFQMLMNRNSYPISKYAIVLLSDGEDDLSIHSLQQAIETADRADISIYAITAHNSRRTHPGDAVLRQLAESTGGHAFILNSFDDADSALAAIEQELRTQYSLSFHPKAVDSCGYHRIAIVPLNLQMRIRARDRYYRCPSAVTVSQSSPQQ
jgi:Ca-activated chloride channel homolog